VGDEQPRVVQARAIIERQVSHMARLLDDLLDVSRVACGKIALVKDRCDLRQLVAQTAEDHRSTLEAGGIELELSMPSEPVWVMGDSTRLSQAVTNVLHNANKFTSAGGRVTVSLAEAAGGWAEVRIRDTGIGIEASMLERVFEPFSQADRGLERSRGGLGLGLALVKGFVELHGGAVSAASAGPGEGAEVLLRLPLLEGVERVEEPFAAVRANPRALRVLIIEDNPDAAESTQTLLELSGHEAAIAMSGSAGLEAARSFHPDVVLCDIGLPGGMDGYAVARALREIPAPERRPELLIALTGYGQEEDQRRAREAGFDVHLVKPVDWSTLEEVLASFASRT
jgi:CheY-like chemotaxis protein/two-component sensor histidine kinase